MCFKAFFSLRSLMLNMIFTYIKAFLLIGADMNSLSHLFITVTTYYSMPLKLG